jgi:hypothetical protein
LRYYETRDSSDQQPHHDVVAFFEGPSVEASKDCRFSQGRDPQLRLFSEPIPPWGAGFSEPIPPRT